MEVSNNAGQLEYSMDDYHQSELDVKARTALHRLKMELSCREDNEHVGSGLGGNPSEFLFLLTHSVAVSGCAEGEPTFSRVGAEEILFRTPPKPSMGVLRRAFTKFLNEEFPNRPQITSSQLMNPSFLRDLGSNRIEVKLLIRALEQTYEVVKWLDLKREMQNKLSELCAKEQSDLANNFLKEMGLPVTYFHDHKDDKLDPMSRMLNKHPVWGARRDAAHKRYDEMCKQLISPEDNLRLQTIGAFPAYITLFVFRACVQIERIVSLNLDELDSCKFLSDINKEMEDEEDIDFDDDTE
jgi:hypothetical protein